MVKEKTSNLCVASAASLGALGGGAHGRSANKCAIETDEIFKIENLTMAYGDYVVMRDLNFSIKKGEIFFIMGGSGCGKSKLLRHMIGLIKPAKGTIYFKGENFSDAEEKEKFSMLRQFGVLYQGLSLIHI